MPLPEANFFGIVIAIQQKAGGNLSEALGNLSRVLRDRKKMKAKIQAMSMEAKASAVDHRLRCRSASMLLVYLTSPDYIELLWTDRLGRIMLAGCAVWMVIGVIVMKQDDQLRLLSGMPCSELLIDELHDPQFIAMLFAAVAAVATVLTLAMPLLSRRHARQAHEGGRARAREDPPARARAAGARREGSHAARSRRSST